jgi:hypothetical protein
MFDLYVYYKVRAENAARLEPLVRAMQARLAPSLPGAATQLKRRPEATDGLQTWMEVYPNADDAFRVALAEAARVAGLEDLAEGRRHTEVFTDLTPCA